MFTDRRVREEWCTDHKSYHNEIRFWCNGKVIVRCDESDYHETVDELKADGYVVSCING